jgi:hypothetical protein
MRLKKLIQRVVGETVKVYGQIPKWEASIVLGVASIIDRVGLGYSLTGMRERLQFLTI